VFQHTAFQTLATALGLRPRRLVRDTARFCGLGLCTDRAARMAVVHNLLPHDIVRAASRTTGPLRAIATVVHSGRSLATAEARLSA